MNPPHPETGDRRSTLLGLVAILFWSTTIAFSRSLTEQLGTLTAAATIYTLAGLVGLLFAAGRPGSLAAMRGLPPRYLIVCGGLFVLYIVGLYLAVGMAATRAQVLAVGLINYLWPGLSLAFSLPLLGKRGSFTLPVGILIALAGVWLATSGTDGIRLNALFEDPSSWLPYGLALGAAVCWALYSNLSRRLAGGRDGGAVPLFLLASGFVLGVLRLVSVETSTWSLGAGLELVYMCLFPGMLAYVLWDIAVRKGEIILVASLSYLTPLLSTLISALVLRVTPSPAVWLGAALVFAGAILCKVSIVDGP